MQLNPQHLAPFMKTLNFSMEMTRNQGCSCWLQQMSPLSLITYFVLNQNNKKQKWPMKYKRLDSQLKTTSDGNYFLREPIVLWGIVPACPNSVVFKHKPRVFTTDSEQDWGLGSECPGPWFSCPSKCFGWSGSLCWRPKTRLDVDLLSLHYALNIMTFFPGTEATEQHRGSHHHGWLWNRTRPLPRWFAGQTNQLSCVQYYRSCILYAFS